VIRNKPAAAVFVRRLHHCAVISVTFGRDPAGQGSQSLGNKENVGQEDRKQSEEPVVSETPEATCKSPSVTLGIAGKQARRNSPLAALFPHP